MAADGKGRLLLAGATVLVSILSSAVAAGFVVGRFEERLTSISSSAKNDSANLSQRLQDLSNKLETLNTTSTNLTAGISSLRSETENLKQTLQNERQDRITDRLERAKH